MTTILEHWMRHRKFGGSKWYYLFGHSTGNMIEQVSLPTFTASDTLQNTAHASEETGSLAPFPGGCYRAEGRWGGIYQDDVSRFPNATKTIVNDVADIGTVRYDGGSASGPHKFWQAGGWNDATSYDDVANMPFATETCAVATSGMMSAVSYGNRMSASKMKILHKLGNSNVIEGWPHATESYADIGDATTTFTQSSTIISDVSWYFENYGQAGNKMSLATETVATYTPEFTYTNGDGSAGHFGVHAGYADSGYAYGNIYSFSFATDTWVDTTQDLTSGTRMFQTRGAA